MTREIQSIRIKYSGLLISVYGFGSFFRSDHANDCDLLLVVNSDATNLGKLHADLSEEFLDLGLKLSIDFDLTILTAHEHKSSPLKEHNRLTFIAG